jgi:hypothetical protein
VTPRFGLPRPGRCGDLRVTNTRPVERFGDAEVAHGGRSHLVPGKALRRYLDHRAPGPRHRRPRVHGPGGALGLRQVDGPADDRRPGEHLFRDHLHRRPGGERRRAQGPRRGHGLPELRALPAPDRPGEHRVRAQDPQAAPAGDRSAGERVRLHPGHRPAPRSQTAAALRRPAATGGGGARHRPQAGRLPLRRAPLEPGRQAPGADARRDQEAAGAAPDHLRLRHPRPGGGHDHGHAHLRAQPGSAAAGRRPARGLRATGLGLRGPVHRHAAHELPARDAARRRDRGGVDLGAAAGLAPGSRRQALRAEGHRRHPARARPPQGARAPRGRASRGGGGRDRRDPRRRDRGPLPGRRRQHRVPGGRPPYPRGRLQCHGGAPARRKRQNPSPQRTNGAAYSSSRATSGARSEGSRKAASRLFRASR